MNLWYVMKMSFDVFHLLRQDFFVFKENRQFMAMHYEKKNSDNLPFLKNEKNNNFRAPLSTKS